MCVNFNTSTFNLNIVKNIENAGLQVSHKFGQRKSRFQQHHDTFSLKSLISMQQINDACTDFRGERNWLYLCLLDVFVLLFVTFILYSVSLFMFLLFLCILNL